MPTWIQHPVTGKLIPKEEYQRPENNAPFIQGDLQTFVSPIDGSVISDRRRLREHNLRHGVTDSRDYSDAWYEKKKHERAAIINGENKKSKSERIDDIQRAISQLERRG